MKDQTIKALASMGVMVAADGVTLKDACDWQAAAIGTAHRLPSGGYRITIGNHTETEFESRLPLTVARLKKLVR